jgi:NTE family protein
MGIRGRRALAACLALAFLAPPRQIRAAGQDEEKPRPRLVLVLSGGGARGVAHIGALRAIEEAGLPVDAIAANSMGAIVGGIYATGRTAKHLEQIVRSLDWAALFSGRADRRTLPVSKRRDRYGELIGVSFDGTKPRFPAGLVASHGVNRFLIEHLAPMSYAVEGDFDRLPIPFRAVATDLGSGECVVLAKGDLARAVRASMSIPLFFPPVDWEGRKLVDGLVVNNLPTDVAKAFGGAVTVAIDIGSPDLDPEDYASSLGVASQISDLLSSRRSRDYYAEPDLLIRPDLGKHSATDYSNFDALIEAGYEATQRALPEIREKLLAAGVADLAARSWTEPGRVLEGTKIAEVVTRGNERSSEWLLRRTFNIPTGRPFEMLRGLRAFDKVEATGLLERAWMEFEPAPEGLRIVLSSKDAAPNRAAIGIGYNEWEKARGWIHLRNQNTLGFGEQVAVLLAASDAETLAEATLSGDRLFTAGMGYRVSAYSFTDKPRYFDENGDELNRAKFERQGVSLALRSALERWGFVEAGARFGRVKTREQVGVALPEASDTVAALFAGFTVDTLDELHWPSAGGRFSAEGEWNLDGMGGTRPFWRLRLEGRLGRGFGTKAALSLEGLLGLSGEDLPGYEEFRVGGPTLVPGYRFEELKGAQALAAAVSVRYTLVGSLRLVARAGAGNVFANTQDIGLEGVRWGVGAGLYAPTRIGPVWVDVGVRDGGKTLVSLGLGGY